MPFQSQNSAPLNDNINYAQGAEKIKRQQMTESASKSYLSGQIRIFPNQLAFDSNNATSFHYMAPFAQRHADFQRLERMQIAARGTTVDSLGRGLWHWAFIGGASDLQALYLTRKLAETSSLGMDRYLYAEPPRDNNQRTPVHYLAMGGNFQGFLEFVRLCVRLGKTDVLLERDARGNNIFYYLMLSGNPDAIAWLLRPSAIAKECPALKKLWDQQNNAKGETFLHFMREIKKPETALIILDSLNKEPDAVRPSEHKEPDAVKPSDRHVQQQDKADVLKLFAKKDFAGANPFHHVCRIAPAPVVKETLLYRYNDQVTRHFLNETTNDGSTVIHFCGENPDPEVASLLLETPLVNSREGLQLIPAQRTAGIPFYFNQRDKAERSVFHRLGYRGQLEPVQRLFTYFHAANNEYSRAVARLCVENDSSRNNVVLSVAASGEVSAISYLVKHHRNYVEVNTQQFVDRCAHSGKLPVIKWLVSSEINEAAWFFSMVTGNDNQKCQFIWNVALSGNFDALFWLLKMAPNTAPTPQNQHPDSWRDLAARHTNYDNGQSLCRLLLSEKLETDSKARAGFKNFFGEFPELAHPVFGATDKMLNELSISTKVDIKKLRTEMTAEAWEFTKNVLTTNLEIEPVAAPYLAEVNHLSSYFFNTLGQKLCALDEQSKTLTTLAAHQTFCDKNVKEVGDELEKMQGVVQTFIDQIAPSYDTNLNAIREEEYKLRNLQILFQKAEKTKLELKITASAAKVAAIIGEQKTLLREYQERFNTNMEELWRLTQRYIKACQGTAGLLEVNATMPEQLVGDAQKMQSATEALLAELNQGSQLLSQTIEIGKPAANENTILANHGAGDLIDGNQQAEAGISANMAEKLQCQGEIYILRAQLKRDETETFNKRDLNFRQRDVELELQNTYLHQMDEIEGKIQDLSALIGNQVIGFFTDQQHELQEEGLIAADANRTTPLQQLAGNATLLAAYCNEQQRSAYEKRNNFEIRDRLYSKLAFVMQYTSEHSLASEKCLSPLVAAIVSFVNVIIYFRHKGEESTATVQYQNNVAELSVDDIAQQLHQKASNTKYKCITRLLDFAAFIKQMSLWSNSNDVAVADRIIRWDREATLDEFKTFGSDYAKRITSCFDQLRAPGICPSGTIDCVVREYICYLLNFLICELHNNLKKSPHERIDNTTVRADLRYLEILYYLQNRNDTRSPALIVIEQRKAGQQPAASPAHLAGRSQANVTNQNGGYSAGNENGAAAVHGVEHHQP